MASSSRAASDPTGAPTPGAPTAGLPLASPEDLRVGEWNMGLPQANSFSKNDRIKDILEDATQKIMAMGTRCNVIFLNELHASLQSALDSQLSEAETSLQMRGWTSGDVLIWRRSTYTCCRRRMPACSCVLP